MHARRDKQSTRNIKTQVVPARATMAPQAVGPSGNDAAMRPGFDFLPFNQDSYNAVLDADKQQWLDQNKDKDACRYPGMADPQGRGVLIGTGNCENAHSCEGGRVWKDNGGKDGKGQCECPDGMWAKKTPGSVCQPYEMANQGGPKCSIM